VSRAFTRTVLFLRLLIVPALVFAAVVSWRELPGVSSLPDAGVRALLPSDTPAAQSEAEADRLFGSSLLPRIAVVQRNPHGLSLDDQRRIVRLALRLDRDELHAFPRGSRALPYLNTLRLVPGARERSTAAITYLGFPASVTPVDQRNYAYQYARAVSQSGATAFATGFIPGTLAQSDLITHNLLWVELAAVLFVAVVIGGYLRSLLAPLVTLAAAGIAYLISIGVVAWLAQTQGLELQNQVEPIVVVLLLGVVTDYSVFFLSGMRGRIRRGEAPADAARDATAEVLPIIVTAALLVAAGLATLRLASIGFVQTLGPAMAVVVLVSLGVLITFVPACMRMLCRRLFWPGLGEQPAVDPLFTRAGAAVRRGVARGTSVRLVAFPVIVVVVVALALAASGIGFTRLALTPIRGLQQPSPPTIAATAAERAFTGGILAPTEIVLRRPGIGGSMQGLRRFVRSLGAQREVGAVFGPGLAPIPHRFEPVFTSRDGSAVRYFVAFRHHPYSSAGISDLSRLERAMPALLANAGLRGVRVLYAGDTALAKETTHRVYHDLLWVGLAAAAVNAAARREQRARDRRNLRADHVRVQGSLPHSRFHVLRSARRRRPAPLVRDGLQPVRRRADLAGGGDAHDRRRHQGRRPSREPRDLDRGCRPRLLVRNARDHPDLAVSRVRRRNRDRRPHRHVRRADALDSRPPRSARPTQLVAEPPRHPQTRGRRHPMTRIAIPLILAAALTAAGCGGKSASVTTSTTVATTPSATTAAGSLSFDLRARRIRQRLLSGLRAIATGNATGVAVGAGTVLTQCTATVTRQLGKRATTAAQQRQVSQLRTACTDIANALAKVKSGDGAAAAKLARTALQQLQQASK
jgi:putative drug exporter of the RND superfamily